MIICNVLQHVYIQNEVSRSWKKILGNLVNKLYVSKALSYGAFLRPLDRLSIDIQSDNVGVWMEPG